MENTTDTKQPASPLLPAPTGSEKWDRLVSLACAAKQLCEWTRIHEYPQSMSTEFIELTGMIDTLDTEVRRVFPNTKLSDGGSLSNKTI